MGADVGVISCCIVYTLAVIATDLAYQFSSVFTATFLRKPTQPGQSHH